MKEKRNQKVQLHIKHTILLYANKMYNTFPKNSTGIKNLNLSARHLSTTIIFIIDQIEEHETNMHRKLTNRTNGYRHVYRKIIKS